MSTTIDLQRSLRKTVVSARNYEDFGISGVLIVNDPLVEFSAFSDIRTGKIGSLKQLLDDRLNISDSNLETFMYPFVPGHISKPKECKNLFFVQMPERSP
ncbi:hypothetical protein BDZ89DRAFT_1132145 [Hymenopellis radicata]|nr:hypothetical protein BDZ89DRAFT_1132145 [Hymenopellis radicata]